jgi:hypothetical protein
MNLRLSCEHHEQYVARSQVPITRIEFAEQRVSNEHPLHPITLDDTAVLTEPSCPWLRVRNRQ